MAAIKIYNTGEVRGGVFSYSIPDFGLTGMSRQPLLDGCRRLMAVGADPGSIAELWRPGTSEAALRVPIGKGAKVTVWESGGAPHFRRIRPGPSGRRGSIA